MTAEEEPVFHATEVPLTIDTRALDQVQIAVSNMDLEKVVPATTEAPIVLPTVKVEKALVISCSSCGILTLARPDQKAGADDYRRQHLEMHRKRNDRLTTYLQQAQSTRLFGNPPLTKEAREFAAQRDAELAGREREEAGGE